MSNPVAPPQNSISRRLSGYGRIRPSERPTSTIEENEMSSYTCPECKDGTLEAKVREIDLELEDGETVEIIGGVVLVSSVGCNNGCSDKPKPKGKKTQTPPAKHASDEACSKSELCSRPNGHTGRHDTKLAERVEG